MSLIKKSILCFVGAQMLFLTAVRADESTGREEMLEYYNRSCDCGAPKGRLYRGYGPNLAGDSGALAKCPLFNDKGHIVGETATYPTNDPTVIRHVWEVKHGYLEVVVENILAFTSPVNAAVVSSFPELSAYLNNSSAGLLVFTSNHSETGDPAVQEWNASGSLRKVNYVEFRCVYLTLNDIIVECVGCHWFFGKIDETFD